MAHFKISLAGQLHFAPHAGDWVSLFVLLFCTGGPSRNITAPANLFPRHTFPNGNAGTPSGKLYKKNKKIQYMQWEKTPRVHTASSDVFTSVETHKSCSEIRVNSKRHEIHTRISRYEFVIYQISELLFHL